MKFLTAATKKRITNDWQGCLPGMGIYKPLHLLRRVGPLLIGVLLERDSSGRTYRPTFHVHNLGRSFPTVALSLAQPLRTERTNAAETIDVNCHNERFEDAAVRLSAQAPLPLAGPVSLSQFIEASMQHTRRPGVHYEPEVYQDMISIVSWAGDTVRAQRLLEDAKQSMSEWPPEVLEQLGGVQRWLEAVASHALIPDAVRRTVDEEIAAHRLDSMPSDNLVF